MKVRIVKGLVALLAGGATAVAVAAGGTGQPTTLGDAQFHVTSAVYQDYVEVQAADQDGLPSYAVPAGGGVVTKWSVQLYNASAPGDLTLKVVQPVSATAYKVVGESTGHILTGDRFRTFATRIPVSGDERLGLKTPPGSGVQVGSSGTSGDSGDIVATTGNATVGQTFTATNFASSSYMAISAVVEPDADHDQYGDISQDDCPADPTRQTGPCVTDLSLALAAAPASIAQGEAAVVSGTVDATLATASGATVSMVLPPGLALITGQATGGACTGTSTVSCPLGDVAPGTPAQAVLAVRGTQAGAQSVNGSAASGTPDANAANDSGSATVTVTPAAAPPKECVVPPLKGLTRNGASKLLKAFSCRLGKVTTKRKPKRGRLRVSAQKPRAATRAPAESKVAITLKRVR
jgi:hypothetical protein